MLPVSGAEQLNTSGANDDAAHDLAQRRVFEIRKPCTPVRFGQEKVPEPGAPGLGFQFLHQLHGLPAIALGDLPSEAGLVRIDVGLHEAGQPLNQGGGLGRGVEAQGLLLVRGGFGMRRPSMC